MFGFYFSSERPGRKISINDLDEELCKMSSEKRHVERMVRYLNNNLSYVLPRGRILSSLSAQLNCSSAFKAFRPRCAQRGVATGNHQSQAQSSKDLWWNGRHEVVAREISVQKCRAWKETAKVCDRILFFPVFKHSLQNKWLRYASVWRKVKYFLIMFLVAKICTWLV